MSRILQLPCSIRNDGMAVHSSGSAPISCRIKLRPFFDTHDKSGETGNWAALAAWRTVLTRRFPFHRAECAIPQIPDFRSCFPSVLRLVQVTGVVQRLADKHHNNGRFLGHEADKAGTDPAKQYEKYAMYFTPQFELVATRQYACTAFPSPTLHQ
jgi:hypothetical protein